MRFLKASLVACFLFAASASANPIQVTLSLEPSSALPGVPVTFRVTATNTGALAAQLPFVVRLEVTSDDGQRFFAIASGIEDANAPFPFPDEFGEEIPLFVEMAPGEQRQLDFVASPDSPPWFCDRRLIQPGVYRLRLISDPNFARGGSPGIDPIVSNEVALTVLTPTGVDAEVWHLPHADDRCTWWSKLAAQLWNLYPTSTYTPLTVRPSPRDDRGALIDGLKATLTANPPRGFADHYREALGRLYLEVMREAMFRGDAPTAIQNADLAREVLTPLAQGDTEWSVRSRAQKLLTASVRTSEEINRFVENLHATDPQPPCEKSRVSGVRDAIRQAITALPANSNAKKKLETAAHSLDAYAAAASSTPRDMAAALRELEQAVGTLQTVVRSGDISATTGNNWMKELLRAAEESAQKAIAAAANDVAAKSKTLAQAKQLLAEAQNLVSTGDYHRAAGKFKDALAKAEASSAKRGDYC